MKCKKIALPIIVSALFFVAACASLSPAGSQYGILHVAECLDWPITAASVRGIIANVDGVYTVSVDPTTGILRVNYDPTKTSPEKLAQKIRDRGYTVDSVEHLK